MRGCQMKKKRQKSKLLQDYENRQKAWKAHIKFEPNKFRRFWKWVWYLIAFPWVWTFYNIRDWRTAVIFVITFLVLSSEVWVPYLLGVIFHSSWLIGVGTACWLFWLGPGTPFMVICIMVTIAVKGLFNKIGEKHGR